MVLHRISHAGRSHARRISATRRRCSSQGESAGDAALGQRAERRAAVRTLALSRCGWAAQELHYDPQLGLVVEKWSSKSKWRALATWRREVPCVMLTSTQDVIDPLLVTGQRAASGDREWQARYQPPSPCYSHRRR